jgi:hypothetical protein
MNPEVGARDILDDTLDNTQRNSLIDIDGREQRMIFAILEPLSGNN